MPAGYAAKVVTEILKNRSSHSYAALAGWHYIPTGAEHAMWDMLAAEGRLKHPQWRPWTSRATDILTDQQAQEEKHQQDRKLLKKVYGIKN